MLMSKSQLQPVTKAAAAGGKRIATRIKRTSEALTILVVRKEEVMLMAG
jgi:hypothetical protein